MCAHLLAKMDSRAKDYGMVIRTYGLVPPPFLTPGVFLHMCSWGLSGPKDRKYVTSGSFAQAGVRPSLSPAITIV